MNLEQLRAWLDSHGGYKDSIPTTQQKVNPLTKLPEDQQVTVMVAADGSQLTVRGTGENTYEVVGEPKIATPAQAAAAAGGNTAPPGGKAFIDDGAEAGASGRRWGWNPDTKAYDRDLGPSPAAQSQAAQTPGKKGTVENGEWVEREIQPNGEPGRITLQRPATQAEKDNAAGGAAVVGKRVDVNPETKRTTVTDTKGNVLEDRPATQPELQGQGAGGTSKYVERTVNGVKKTYIVSLGPNGEELGVAESAIPAETPAAPIVDPSKPQAEVVTDPTTGQRTARPIAGTGEQPGPDIGPVGQQIWGDFAKRFGERVQQRLDLVRTSNGSYTMEQARKDMESDRAELQLQLDEKVKTLNEQQNIRAQDISQRGQTLTDAGNRQRFAETASTNALNLVTKFPSIAARAGSGEGLTNVLQYLMNMQGEYGKTIGALPDQTPIGRAPGQEQVMGQGIGGPATNGPAPSVGPGAGGSPIVFNINTNGTSPAPITPDLGTMGSTMAAGVQPDAASQATPVGSPGSPSQLIDQWHDPKAGPYWQSALEQIKAELPEPQGGQQTVPGGMRFAGGQLRAPGAVGGGPVSNGAVGAVG